MPILPKSEAAPRAGLAGRLLRLHSFEILIFATLFVLLAFCLAASSLVSAAPAAGAASIIL